MFVSSFSIDDKTPYLALGAVKNISLNISISNLGDDAYDANVSFNFSRELFFINIWQKVRFSYLHGRVFILFLTLGWGLAFAMILPRRFLYVEKHLELFEFSLLEKVCGLYNQGRNPKCLQK